MKAPLLTLHSNRPYSIDLRPSYSVGLGGGISEAQDPDRGVNIAAGMIGSIGALRISTNFFLAPYYNYSIMGPKTLL